MIVLGFDPGQTGAVACLSLTGDLIAVHDMPVIDRQIAPTLLWDLLDGLTPTLAVIENVHSMPKQGVASSFKFGVAKGVCQGVVAALGCPVETPTPTVWKKAMQITASKDRARALAVQLWPDHARLFARKKDDGRAEAALLAEWGRRLLVNRGQVNGDG